ncbi:hypothetical protein ACVWYU_004656 [Pseudomonas sp. TE12234]
MSDSSVDQAENTDKITSTAKSTKPPVPVVEWPKLGAVYSDYIRICGTCVDNAQVELLISSSWVTVPAIGTKWSHSLKDFSPGDHTFQVRQTVDGITSDPGPVPTFIVRDKGTIPLPEVTEPNVNSSIPIGGIVQFKGSCTLNATVAVFDLDENMLGKAVVTGTTWSYAHTWRQSQVAYVKIRQVVGDDVSDVVGRWIGVGLTNNELEFTWDTPEDTPGQRRNVPMGISEFSGTRTPYSGTESFTYVVTWWGNADYYGYSVGDRWKVMVGPHRTPRDEYVDIEVGDGHSGQRISKKIHQQFIRIIDTPRPPAPSIRVPVTGSTHPVGALAIDGLCEVGNTVELLNGAGTKLNDALVVDNKWYSSLTLGEGSHSIQARQSKNGLTSEPSAVVQFTVARP